VMKSLTRSKKLSLLMASVPPGSAGGRTSSVPPFRP